jgi:hypothetical protein
LDVELSELFREVSDTLYREEKLAQRVGSTAGSSHGRISTAGVADSGPQVRAMPTVAA